MGRIGERFARLKKSREAALIPFLMAGDPDLDATRELVLAATEAGADLIELGVPFSDPTADGPVLQRSATRAIERGTSLPRVLDLVGQLRREIDTPIILFGYYNPIFRYGPARLAADAKSAGVDGLLVVDLPPEEAGELWKPACRAGLDLIFLLAPTSDQRRIKAVLKKARGFVYYVSMTGVTGSKSIEATDVRQAVDGMRDRCRLPIGVGFGINSTAAARDVAEFADAVVVGSALMRLVETQNGDPRLVESVAAFIRDLKSATRRPTPAAA